MSGIWKMQMQINTPIVTLVSAMQYNRELYNESAFCPLYINMSGDEDDPFGCIWVCVSKTIDWKRIAEIHAKYLKEFDFSNIPADKIDDTFVQIIGRNIAKGFRENFTDDLFLGKLREFNRSDVLSLDDGPPGVYQYVHFLCLDELSHAIKNWIKEKTREEKKRLDAKIKEDTKANHILQCVNNKLQEETDIINKASSIFTNIDDLWTEWKKRDNERKRHTYKEPDSYCNITGYIEWKLYNRYHQFYFSNDEDKSQLSSPLGLDYSLPFLSKNIRELFTKYAKQANSLAQYLLWTYKDLLIAEMEEKNIDDFIKNIVRKNFKNVSVDPIILAQNGSIIAMVDDGYRLAEGKSSERNFNKAYQYFLSAALSCHPEGMVGLAYLYRTGGGVERDLSLANKWASLASSLGCSAANEELKKLKKNDLKPTPPSSNCFITAAVCDSFGKPDDCYELTMFRQFRDTWLCKQEDGESLIKDYYAVAPRIVFNINRLHNAKEVYRSIWTEYLKPCLLDLEADNKASCKNRYVRMVKDLKEIYWN